VLFAIRKHPILYLCRWLTGRRQNSSTTETADSRCTQPVKVERLRKAGIRPLGRVEPNLVVLYSRREEDCLST
jgi:hypothetical protein